MVKMIYTTYHANSFKIIKSRFSTYELPHAPVNFSINFSIFSCFENSDKAENFRQTVPIYGRGGHLNFRHCQPLISTMSVFSVWPSDPYDISGVRTSVIWP